MIVSKGRGMWSLGIGGGFTVTSHDTGNTLVNQIAAGNRQNMPKGGGWSAPPVPKTILRQSPTDIGAGTAWGASATPQKSVFDLPTRKGSLFNLASYKGPPTDVGSKLVTALTESVKSATATTAPTTQQAAAVLAATSPLFGTTSSPLTYGGGGGGGGGGAVDESPQGAAPQSWWEGLSTGVKAAIVGGGALVAFFGYRMLSGGGRSATAPKS